MKRISNLYDRICSLDNLILADHLASKGKSTVFRFGGAATNNFDDTG